MKALRWSGCCSIASLPSHAASRASAPVGRSKVFGREFCAPFQKGNRASYSTQGPMSRSSGVGSNTRPAMSTPQYQSEGAVSQVPLQHTPQSLRSYSSTSQTHPEPMIHHLFEEVTGTWQYVVVDPDTSAAAIIDPVLDYDPVTQAITTKTADAILSLVKEKGYRVDWLLETHAHADHLTAASYLQKRLTQEQGSKPSIGIGKRIEQVQNFFGERYGIVGEEYAIVFDKLFNDDETFNIGNLSVTALHLPGHTPDHLGYKVGDNVFCGDTLFHADIGSARCDFPGGQADQLWDSGRKLLNLADHTKIWTGHDYPPEDRGAPEPYMTVEDHKKLNKHLREGISRQEFIALRTERDASLAAPRLLHQSLQVNIRAGHLPKPTEAGLRLLHLPLKITDEEAW